MFLVNIPVGLVAITGIVLFLNESKDEHSPPIDYPGVVLSILGLFLLIYGIIDAGVYGWTSPNVLFALAMGIVLLAIFGWWEAHSPHAMLPMRFFKNMSFTSANVSLTLVSFGQFTFLFFLIPNRHGPHEAGHGTMGKTVGEVSTSSSRYT